MTTVPKPGSKAAEAKIDASVRIQTTEMAAVADLRSHPRNYRAHPGEQLEHLAQSLREHGLYRSVVVARDGTILAGHGIAEAAKQLGLEEIPVVRLDLDPNDPKAMKILTGDNELTRLAEVDDRLLSELLREIAEADVDGLLGTGFDEQMLANLVYVTRMESEIPTLDHAGAWAGMPEFESFEAPYRVVVSLDSLEDTERFLAEIGVEVINRKDRETWSVRWPPRPKEDLSSLFFEPAGDGA